MKKIFRFIRRIMRPRRGFCSLILLIVAVTAIITSCVSRYYVTAPEGKVPQTRRWNFKHHHQCKNNHHLGPFGKRQPTKQSTRPTTTKPLQQPTTAKTVRPKNAMRDAFVFQLMPHLKKKPASLKPAYIMKSPRKYCEMVIGVPTVARDKESYIIVTLMNLVDALTEEEKSKTLIILFFGDTDVEAVKSQVQKLKLLFPEPTKSGLIEIISPSTDYYPDLDSLPLNFGDSTRRVKWRTKQNLDHLYLMAYGRNRGKYYLMLEDDVTVKNNYRKLIMEAVQVATKTKPDWFVIEFCNIGGIGKFFKTSDLMNFMVYIQLFYKNLPIDWLLESYISDRVCSLDRASPLKLENRPLFFPHVNPPTKRIYTNLPYYKTYTLSGIYLGENFFWGRKQAPGHVMEFWFREPTTIYRYTIRSGNVLHQRDILYGAVLEVLPDKKQSFTMVDKFDEFGFAKGELKLGRLLAVRIRIMKASSYWVIISEINLSTSPKPSPPIWTARPRHMKVMRNV